MMAGCATLLLAAGGLLAFIETATAQDTPRGQYVRVLCVTTGEHPVGEAISVQVLFTTREDTRGLDIHFLNGPGRLSAKTQTTIAQEISRAARVFGLSTDSWSVEPSVPYPGITIEGDSLSAMVSLTVVAVAKGQSIPVVASSRAPSPRTAKLGRSAAVVLKVMTARQAGLQMVLVPALAHNTWRTPASFQASPVRTVTQAYQMLTGTQNPLTNDLWLSDALTS